MPLADLDAAFLRREVACVEQQPVLFNRSFLDNIAMGFAPAGGWGSPAERIAAVKAAATSALAHEFIMEKGGYDAAVTERGMLATVLYELVAHV